MKFAEGISGRQDAFCCIVVNVKFDVVEDLVGRVTVKDFKTACPTVLCCAKGSSPLWLC